MKEKNFERPKIIVDYIKKITLKILFTIAAFLLIQCPCQLMTIATKSFGHLGLTS